MSDRTRSFGVSFYCVIVFLGATAAFLFQGLSFQDLIKDPTAFPDSIEYLRQGLPWTTLNLFVENMTFFLGFFVAVGLWRLKRWAYHLVFVLLGMNVLSLGLQFYIKQLQLQGGFSVGFVVGALCGIGFWFWFFRRDSVQEQFEEDWIEELKTPLPTAGAAAGVGAGALHPLISARLNLQSVETDEEPIWKEPLTTLEKTLSMILVGAGIAYSMRFSMGIVEGGIFGGIWGLEASLFTIYLSRGKKLSALVGGVLSLILSLGILRYLKANDPLAYVPVVLGVNAGSNILGGFAGSLFSKKDKPFHGSGAGFLWALIVTGISLSEKIQAEKVSPAEVPQIFLGMMLLGIISAAVGGFFAGLICGKRSSAKAFPGAGQPDLSNAPSAGGMHPLIAAKLKQGDKPSHASGVGVSVGDLGSLVKWGIYLGVVALAYIVHKMDGLQLACFCVFWGFDFFFLKNYWENAKKFPALIGGLVAVLLGVAIFLLGNLLLFKGEKELTRLFYSSLLANMGIIMGGFVSAKMAKSTDDWYQGSSAGCVCSLITFFAMYYQWGGAITQKMEQFPQLQFLFQTLPLILSVYFLFMFIVETAFAAIGGTLAGIFSRKEF